MPIIEIVDVTDISDELSEATGRIFMCIVENIAAVREIRARGKRGPKAAGRPRVLTPTLKFQVDVTEDPTELARSFAKRIVEIITTDAAGEAWEGVVELVGDPDEKQKIVILDSPKVTISAGAPQPKATREDEFVGILATLRETIKGLGDVCVRVGSTKADELAAYASMATALATALAAQNKSDGKWAYKIAKEKEETARVTEEERSRAQRSANFWDAMSVWAEEWKDVAVIWSEFFAAGGRNAPARPTDDEVRAVFTWPEGNVNGRPWHEIFDPIRAVVATMLAEPDVKRRCQIAKDDLKAAINRLSKPEQDAMKMRMVLVLGELRTKEVAAWLSVPVT